MANAAIPFGPTRRPFPARLLSLFKNGAAASRTLLLGQAKDRRERVLVLVLLLVGLVAHGFNMFNFPAITLLDDEGIYTAQAWSVLRIGQLTPYTYFYDHSPVGWIMIAGWMWVSGGFHAFGAVIDGARLMMLLMHLAMVPMLYRLARKLGCVPLAAGLATLLFSLSPLATFYQRFVLLDSIMLFWMLISLNLLLDDEGRLSRVILSGFAFGLGVLSKETGIFLLPVMVYMVWYFRRKHQGRFPLLSWLVPMAIVVSWYPLYALLKGELLPAGINLNFLFLNFNTGSNHVSLFEALSWQATRGGGGLTDLNNMFWQLVRGDWAVRDPILFIGGSVAIILNLVWGIRNRRALIAGALGFLPLFYLGRGGLVLNYYILFLIPFLCLNLAFLLNPVLARLPRRIGPVVGVVLAAGLVAFYWASGQFGPLYTANPSIAGRQAMEWISQNVPPESKIITRDDVWTDLREPDNKFNPRGGLPYLYSHWKVGGDPAIYEGVFKQDWRNVDYLIMSPGLEAVFKGTNDKLALEALAHAHRVKRWTSEGAELELWKVEKVSPADQELLSDSSAYLSHQFDKQGAFTEADGSVRAENQSNALLRAAWTDDRAGFERVWKWTGANLLRADGLLAGAWQKGKVTEAANTSVADSDTAYALMYAGRRWNDPALVEAGRKLAGAIWEHNVALVDGAPYLLAGEWAWRDGQGVVNPGYFAPYAYRLFAEVDPAHDWKALIASGYKMLDELPAQKFGAKQSAWLPPDWIALNLAGGADKWQPLKLEGQDSLRYGSEAAQVAWRIALDWRLSSDPRAMNYLKAHSDFLKDEAGRKGYLSGVYAHDGTLVQDAPSQISTASGLALLQAVAPTQVHRLYASEVMGRTNRLPTGIYWRTPGDLTSQDWGWFATALYLDALPKLYPDDTRL